MNQNQEPVKAIAANYRRQPTRYVRRQRPTKKTVTKSTYFDITKQVNNDSEVEQNKRSKTEFPNKDDKNKQNRVSRNEDLEEDTDVE